MTHKHTKTSFHTVYNALHNWRNRCEPCADTIEKALQHNCEIHNSHAALLGALESALQFLPNGGATSMDAIKAIAIARGKA